MPAGCRVDLKNCDIFISMADAPTSKSRYIRLAAAGSLPSSIQRGAPGPVIDPQTPAIRSRAPKPPWKNCHPGCGCRTPPRAPHRRPDEFTDQPAQFCCASSYTLPDVQSRPVRRPGGSSAPPPRTRPASADEARFAADQELAEHGPRRTRSHYPPGSGQSACD